MIDLLPKSHRILEKGMMEFRPFGKDPDGRKIQDVSGLTIRANVDYLVELVTQTKGPQAGTTASQDLAGLLNARISDPAYHVTPAFLRNPWNGYSYEFAMFLSEFCVELTGNSQFHFNLGRTTLLSPIIQSLGRPFSITQIYKLYPYFVEKFTKGALLPEVVSVTDHCAIMRLKLSPQTARQFGRYRLGCVERICDTTKATIAETPANMFGLKAASIEDQCCMADGAEYCEWVFRWTPAKRPSYVCPTMGSLLLGGAVWGWLQSLDPFLNVWIQTGFILFPIMTVWMGLAFWLERKGNVRRDRIIQEQLEAAETRHEELRKAYVEQEHTVVELRQRLKELTLLNVIGSRLSSSLDRDTVIRTALRLVMEELRYDRAMISFFDRKRRLAYKAWVEGVAPDIAALASQAEVPVRDPETIEGTVLLKGQPILIENLESIRTRIHPINQRLIDAFHTQAFIAVPLTVKNTILGAMVADRTTPTPLSREDLNLLMTVGTQIALALDNADAYAQIEHLNMGLETKIRERTFELEQSNRQLATTNEQLQEMDRVKSQFLSHCSHELRTPLTSIKGFTENLLQGLCGSLTEKQHSYLERVHTNANRLTRMISDLLDLSRIEAGKIHLRLEEVQVYRLVSEVTELIAPLAEAKHQRMTIRRQGEHVLIRADPDRLTQILTNLIHNAIKFTPENGLIEMTVTGQDLGFMTIAVRDTGTGIPEEAIPHLFEPFFQGHRQTEIGAKGLGLGLSIVKTLIDLHHGDIQVHSQPGSGTTFTLFLPVCVESSSLSPAVFS